MTRAAMLACMTLLVLSGCAEPQPSFDREIAIFEALSEEPMFTAAPPGGTITSAGFGDQCRGSESGFEPSVGTHVWMPDPFNPDTAEAVLDYYEGVAADDGWLVVEAEPASDLGGSERVPMLEATRRTDGVGFTLWVDLTSDGYGVIATPELGTFCRGPMWE